MDSIIAGLEKALRIKIHPVRKHAVRRWIFYPKYSAAEMLNLKGDLFDETCCDTIITDDADIYVMEGGKKKLLARFRKQALPLTLTEVGWSSFSHAATHSMMRAAAAGAIDISGVYWSKRRPVNTRKWSTGFLLENGQVSSMRVANQVYSSVVGYINTANRHAGRCRLTEYTAKHMGNFRKGMPFIEAIDKQFAALCPEQHAAQVARANMRPDYQIAKTAFSSITVNRNFRTALHQDDGDFKDGFGNLTVLERGSYHGGYTMFPQYGVGVDVRHGDVLLMDVHQWHCNSPLYETEEDAAINALLEPIYRSRPETGTHGSEFSFTRLAFVCYLRDGLLKCPSADESQVQDSQTFALTEDSNIVAM